MDKKAKHGVIYILTNPSFPDYIKIGYADDIEKRLKKLNSSEHVPFAFRVYATYSVDSRLTDKELHRLIDSLNPDLRTIETFDGKERVKEFYAMSAEDAYALLECIAKISGTENRLQRLTPEGHEILDEEIAKEVTETVRKGPFRFSMCNIQPGAEVVFIQDQSVKAIVVDDRHIQYQGETTSLSALAARLLKTSSAQGTLYFSYEGTVLSDLRDKIESI